MSGDIQKISQLFDGHSTELIKEIKNYFLNGGKLDENVAPDYACKEGILLYSDKWIFQESYIGRDFVEAFRYKFKDRIKRIFMLVLDADETSKLAQQKDCSFSCIMPISVPMPPFLTGYWVETSRKVTHFQADSIYVLFSADLHMFFNHGHGKAMLIIVEILEKTYDWP